MTDYEIYTFILCLVVFVMLVSITSVLLFTILKQQIRMIRNGLEDRALKIEYRLEKEKSRLSGFGASLLSGLFSLLFLAIFVAALLINLQEDLFFENIPTLKMVNSGSMSEKHEKNTYLFENELNDQFDTFSLVLVYKAPAEEALELYDIVLYEVDGAYIIHRIVGIEEPNENHPHARYFLCQGDANEMHDRFPVYYSQIKGIYKGQNIPFVGSFITFLQSPAGWICLLLVVFAGFGMPFLERKIEREKRLRLLEIGFIDRSGHILSTHPLLREKERGHKK